MLLSAAAIWCVLWGTWDMNVASTRRLHHVVTQGIKTTLHDMTRVTIAMSCALLGLACQVIGAGIFLGWVRHIGWILWLGFLALWLATTALIVVLMGSWWPQDLP